LQTSLPFTTGHFFAAAAAAAKKCPVVNGKEVCK